MMASGLHIWSQISPLYILGCVGEEKISGWTSQESRFAFKVIC
jgi:hypothetical protein